jgi:HlyD family secretion protein
VKFGLSSSVDIEVVSGLKAGDRIIVSEQSSFERHKQVALN